jgi:hypothetical protein
MTKLKIAFERGGVFEAELFEEDAPKTCEIIRNHLPFEYRFQQSIVSGHAMLALPPDLTVPRENQRVAGIPTGTLTFLVRDDPVLVPDEIYIAYGIFISRGLTVDAKQPVNVFAQITSDLDELAKVGRRIHLEGAEMVRFSLAEPE